MHIQVLLIDAWDFDLENDLLLILINIDGRHKAGCRHGTLLFVQIAEERVDAILQ
jgi:glucose dehydrogenase